MKWSNEIINPFVTCVLLSLFVGCLCDMILKHILKQEEVPKTAHIGMTVTAVFLCVYGFSIQALQCALLCQILLFASIIDIKTHTVPDYVHILILMVGLLRFEPVPALVGLLVVPMPFLIAALCKSNSIGGGDIKLMGACGFVIGVSAGYGALTLGLVMSVLFNSIYNKEKKPFALIPYLAFGCFIACFPT